MIKDKSTTDGWKVFANLKLFLLFFAITMAGGLRVYYYFDVELKTSQFNEIERDFLEIQHQYIGYELQTVVNDLSVMIGHHSAIDDHDGASHATLLGSDTEIKQEFDKEAALLCTSRRNYSGVKIIDNLGHAQVSVQCINGVPTVSDIDDLSLYDDIEFSQELQGVAADAVYITDIMSLSQIADSDAISPYLRIAAVLDNHQGIATKYIIIDYLAQDLTSSRNDGLMTFNTTAQGGQLILANNAQLVYPYVDGLHKAPVAISEIIGQRGAQLLSSTHKAFQSDDFYLNRISVYPQQKLSEMLLRRPFARFNTVASAEPLEWSLISMTPKAGLAFGIKTFVVKTLILVPFITLFILPIAFSIRRSKLQQAIFQSRMNEQRTFLITMLDSMNEAVIATDLQGRVQTINPAVSQILGYTNSDLLNRDIAPILPVGTQSKFRSSAQWLNKQSQNRKNTLEYDCIHLNGTWIPVELTVSRSVDAENPFYLLVIRNMTNQREIESEMKNLHQKYIHREKLAEVGLLVGGILHEVSNPLAAIHGLLSNLLYVDGQRSDHNFDPQTREHFTIVFEHIERVRGLSYEVSSFLKPTSYEMTLTDLNSVMHTTSSLIRFDHRWRDIDLKIDLDRNLPAIMAIGDQLVQVMMNLLLNAADACEGITTRKPTIELETHYQDGKARVIVKDNGKGMSEETVRKIFQPFFTTKGDSGGTGLGMPLCEGIINDHGGYMDIVSTPGEGTTITCVLPVHTES